MPLNDRITEHADWREGMNQFREVMTRRIEALEAQLDMLIGRIKDIENSPEAPHTPIKEEEELKLWPGYILRK